MKTSRRKTEGRPKAQDIFTDRVPEQQYVGEFFAKLCASPFLPPEKAVISFYGVGGIGKSALLKRVVEAKHDQQRKTSAEMTLDFAICDIDKDEFKPDYSPMKFYGGRLRPILDNLGIKLPLFDLLYLAWWGKTSPNRPIDLASHVDGLLGTAGDVSSTLGTFMDVIGNIAGGIQAGQLGLKVAGHFRKQMRQQEFREMFGSEPLENQTDQELERCAPTVLAADIRRYLERSTNKAFCLIIDGFERIQSTVRESDGIFNYDLQWSLKDLIEEIVSLDLRTGIILFGREKLNWSYLYDEEDDDARWDDHIDSHRMGALVEENAREFIQKVIDWSGRNPESGQLGQRVSEMISAVLESANDAPRGKERLFHPYCLDLAITLIADKGSDFKQEMLGRGSRELQERFLRYMDASKYKAFQVLALTREFDKALFDHLVRERRIEGYALQDFSLLINSDMSYIAEDPNRTGSYRFHRLMQLALMNSFRRDLGHRGQLAAKEIVSAIFGHYYGLMRRALDIKDVTMAAKHFDQLAELVIEHQTDQLLDWKTFVELADKMEDKLDRYFNLETRVRVQRRYLHLIEASVAHDDLLMATSLNRLASLLRDKGDYDRAEPLCRRAYSICEDALGPNDMRTAAIMSDLAVLLRCRGDYDGAETFSRRALDIVETTFGPDDPKTASCLGNLALVLSGKGDEASSESLHRRALQIRERFLGSCDPQTADSLNNLAGLLRKKGDYDSAERLEQRALAIREETFAPEHIKIAMSLVSLAKVHDDKGDHDGAEALYRRALHIYERASGPGNRKTASCLCSLAAFYCRRGDYDSADPLLRRALETWERTDGLGHFETAICRNRLAACCYSKGDFVSFEPLYLAIVEEGEWVLHPNAHRTTNSLNELARLLHRNRDYERAESVCRRALEISEQKFGADDPKSKRWRNFLEMLLRDKGNSCLG